MTGSPRTLYEGKRIIPLLKKLYGTKNIKIILIKVSAEESIFRNSHRRICELMRHPILYTKETIKLTRCPLDGSKLIRRKGLDDPETIKVVKAVAVDGFSANYDSELVNKSDTVVAYDRAEGPLAEGEAPFRMVLPGQEGKLNVRQMIEIQVIP